MKEFYKERLELLKIGAEIPEEIAVGIAAELIKVRRERIIWKTMLQ